MPARKTFANNAVLPASDLNTYMNPSTAAHVPDAVTALTFSIPAVGAGAVATIDIPLPTGRFTQPPIFVAMSNHYRITCHRVSSTTDLARVQVFNNTSVAAPATAGVLIAMQMTPTSAPG